MKAIHEEFLSINANGYSLLLPLAAIALILFRHYRSNIWNVVVSMNLLMAISAALSLTLFLINIVSPKSEKVLDTTINRLTGPHWWAYWFLLTGITILPLSFFLKKFQRNLFISFYILLAMNMERIIAFLVSFDRDYLPSAWLYFGNPFYKVLTFLIYLAAVGVIYYFLDRKRIYSQSEKS